MADYFGYLASISAVLGGFALAFFGTLFGRTEGRASAWTMGLSAAAAGAFTVTALGWALAASDLALAAAGTSLETAQALVVGFRPIHRWLSILFIGGIFLFLGALGAAGWMRSRRMGVLTATIAVVASAGVVYVLAQFVG